jgi:hypothetical protein
MPTTKGHAISSRTFTFDVPYDGCRSGTTGSVQVQQLDFSTFKWLARNDRFVLLIYRIIRVLLKKRHNMSKSAEHFLISFLWCRRCYLQAALVSASARKSCFIALRQQQGLILLLLPRQEPPTLLLQLNIDRFVRLSRSICSECCCLHIPGNINVKVASIRWMHASRRQCSGTACQKLQQLGVPWNISNYSIITYTHSNIPFVHQATYHRDARNERKRPVVFGGCFSLLSLVGQD